MEQKYLDLCQRAKSVGAVDYSPPPMRAVQGLSMTYEQLSQLVDLEVQARLKSAEEQTAQVINNAKKLDYQTRVGGWLVECFGDQIANDIFERSHRFFEESTELVQSTGMTREECHMMVDYTFNRPIGVPRQEVGGTMVTLAALCRSIFIDMFDAGEEEYDRIIMPEIMQKIREKQKSKPHSSPLPM